MDDLWVQGRARAQRSGHVAYIETSRLRAGLEHEADPRTLIRDYLVQRVEHGAVKGRADVVSALEDVGLEVPRQGKDYITACDPDSGKRWRLKRELYDRDLDPERLDLPAEEQAGGGSRRQPRASSPSQAPRCVPSRPIRRWRPSGCASC